MKILYFNNCWFTNIGEAFIDLGGIELTKQIFPHAQIACISAMSDFYVTAATNEKKIFQHPRKYLTAKMNSFLEADYVVVPGMVGTLEYLNAPSRKMIDELLSRDCKLILLGLGGGGYTVEEQDAFARYLAQTNPALIITRDKEIYNNYNNFANCINGIDCAFWVRDVFNPCGFGKSDYDMVTFNRSKEPDVFNDWNYPIIRAWHNQYGYTKAYYRDNILISDTPYDYLTAYANAHRVYTDLVHASIVSLGYGVPVKYWYIDKRSYAFYALNGLQTDKEGFMSIASKDLEMQKEEISRLARNHLKIM